VDKQGQNLAKSLSNNSRQKQQQSNPVTSASTSMKPSSKGTTHLSIKHKTTT